MTNPLSDSTLRVELEALLKHRSVEQKRFGMPDFVSNTPDDMVAEYLLAVLRARGAPISHDYPSNDYPSPLLTDLENFLSHHSLDKAMNTTYHGLAAYLAAMMAALDATIKRRDQWHGVELGPGGWVNILERIPALTDEQLRTIMTAGTQGSLESVRAALLRALVS